MEMTRTDNFGEGARASRGNGSQRRCGCYETLERVPAMRVASEKRMGKAGEAAWGDPERRSVRVFSKQNRGRSG